MTRLISAEDVKAHLNVRQGNNTLDTKINDMIATVTMLIETECRQKFARQERRELHSARDVMDRTLNLYGDGDAVSETYREQIIPLRATPLDMDAPIKVYYDPQRKFTEDTLLQARFYSVEPDLSRILLNYPTRAGRSTILVTYTAGYEEGNDGTLRDAIPADLRQAAVIATLNMWNRMSELSGIEKDADSKGRGAKGSYGLPRECLPFLTPYRRVLTGRG